jgi:hypothetical protein
MPSIRDFVLLACWSRAKNVLWHSFCRPALAGVISLLGIALETLVHKQQWEVQPEPMSGQLLLPKLKHKRSARRRDSYSKKQLLMALQAGGRMSRRDIMKIYGRVCPSEGPRTCTKIVEWRLTTAALEFLCMNHKLVNAGL